MDMLSLLMENRTVTSKHDYFNMDQSFVNMMISPYNKLGIYLNFSCEFGKYMFLKVLFIGFKI